MFRIEANALKKELGGLGLIETGATAACISCHAFLRWMRPRLSHVFWCDICLDSRTLECKGSTLISVRGKDFRMRDILELEMSFFKLCVYLCFFGKLLF